MIMNGECLNAFCATRPPGHHAGRELHAMNAISNGFCILNTVACAAMYATAPILQGGLGLSRVCVIDIDVHHGNGTQDILCSTYDPRFLYVSMHAGGPDINGVDFEDDNLDQLEHHFGGNPKENEGIFPGRCGDISPHKGVLNIPLGRRVTPHALGTALVTKVTPTVDKFNPELIIISAGK
ncbi:MAG: acetoin utilization deacetylase AcuC-like enzyme [Bacillariaceae sp.]|jgi:acetoin utilization deacetylase AcuC-like enzyme